MLVLAACNGGEGAVVASPISARVNAEPVGEPEAAIEVSGWAAATRTPWAAEPEGNSDRRELAHSTAWGGEDAARQ